MSLGEALCFAVLTPVVMLGLIFVLAGLENRIFTATPSTQADGEFDTASAVEPEMTRAA